MTVVKGATGCPGTSCSTGTISSYTERLSMAPAAGTSVMISAITDGQTNAIISPSGGVTLQAIGYSRTASVFSSTLATQTTQVVNHGLYTGNVIYNAAAGTLTLADGSSWLDNGFLEGQLFQLGGTGQLYKIQSLTGSGPGKVDVLTVTAAAFDPLTGAEAPAPLPFTGAGSATMTLRQWAAVVTFNSSNWWILQTVQVAADPYYGVPAAASNFISFPKQPHLLSNLGGPVVVIGSNAADVNVKLSNAVMLPTEQNGPLFGIAPQPPDALQVKTLNIFNDGAQADGTGTMSAMGLTGFGMSGPQAFVTTAFGVPLSFPGGITWGGIDQTTGTFSATAGLSTIDSLNLMLGQGNDHLTITGTPVPGPTLTDNLTSGPVAAQGGLTIVQGGGAALLQVTGQFNIGTTTITTPGLLGPTSVTASTITRNDGLPWSAYEFVVGQQLLLGGRPAGTITAVNGPTLTVSGTTLTPGSGVSSTVAVFGPKITSTGPFTFLGNTIARTDLNSWSSLGFAVGQQITVGGVVVGTVSGLLLGTMTLTGPSFPLLVAQTATVSVFDPTKSQVAVGGNAITVTGGGGPGAGATIPTTSGTFNLSGNAIQRTDCTLFVCGSWNGDGFMYGDVVQIGSQALWTVAGFSSYNSNVMYLSGPALPTTTINNTTVRAFAPSPLVVMGGTSQDGVWYSGDLQTQTARSFGSKPFPNTVGNGTPNFVFPVADPFRYFGNNVIDASQQFAAQPSYAPLSFGLTAYGGPGQNTFYSSNAPDIFVTGSGPAAFASTSLNLGEQRIYDSGLNVNPINRALAFPTRNFSAYPNSDPLVNDPWLVPRVFMDINGVTHIVPVIPPITVPSGTVPPQPPNIAINQSDMTASNNTQWFTNKNHPGFQVTYQLLFNGLTTPATLFANGQQGTNATLYMNGKIYSQEPLADGRYTVTGTITDYYGNTSGLAAAPKQLVVDTAGPSGGFTFGSGTPINGQVMTSSTGVTLTLSYQDSLSGLSQFQVSTDGGVTYGALQAYATTVTVTLPQSAGLYTIAVKVFSVAGSATVTSNSIRLVTSGPTITASLSAPTNGTSYDLGGTITASYGASDISTVRSVTLTIDGSTATGPAINVDLLTAGQHTLTITAVDGVGNSSTRTLTFQVHATLGGLVAAVNDGASHSQLTASEQATLVSILRGTGPIKTVLSQFTTEVQNQSGKAIASAEAALLTNWAQDLLSRS